MDLSTVEQQIASMLGQQETGNGTAGVGLSLNNPGALKYAGWESTYYGATAAPSGFAQFPSLAAGRNALVALVDKYIQSGSSLSSLMDKYAPPSDGLGAGLGVMGPQTQAATLAATQSAATAAGSAADIFGTVTWGRFAAFVGGLLCLIAGLMLLKQTQTVIENVQASADKTVKTVAPVAEAAAVA